jgi:3-oxoadipate enol-lactonase
MPSKLRPLDTLSQNVRMVEMVDVPGGRLHVVDDGSGPPIVLLHAGIADLRSWDSLVPRLVEAGYRVIRYDGRGFGRTETADVEFSNREDLVALLDACAVTRAALVGNSRGGHIAFDTAIEFPDRVVAVVGVGAGLGGFDGGSTPDEQPVFDEMERLYEAEPPDAAAIADVAVRVWVDGPGQPQTRVPERIRAAVRDMVVGTYAPGHLDGRPIVLDPPASARLTELRCPVLAIAGALDTSAIVATARHLEASVPNAQALVMPSVAHMIGMEAPDELATLIVGFLRPLGHWS